MKVKVFVGLLALLLGVAACDVDTGDPHGDGADVVQTTAPAPTESGPMDGPPATPSGELADPTGQPTPNPPETTGELAPPTSPGQPDPGPEEAEPAGTYTNPLPAGTTFVLSDRIDGEGEPVAHWEITLGPTDTDATDEVLAENEFNEIVEGRSAVMTEVTATYVGPETGNAWLDLSFSYLGSDGNTFAYGDEDYCGVIPNNLNDHGEQFPGAMVAGNVCQAVPEDVIQGGMWIVALAFAWDDQRVFVSAG